MVKLCFKTVSILGKHFSFFISDPTSVKRRIFLDVPKALERAQDDFVQYDVKTFW